MIEYSFLLIVLIALFFFRKGVTESKSFVFFQLAWLLLIGIISSTPFLDNPTAIPPRIMFIMIPTIIYTIYFYHKFKYKTLSANYLLLVHALRIPVEFALLEIYLGGQIPVEMTFEGWNFDILMGITALILFLVRVLTQKTLPSSLVITWNVIGIIMLTTIVVIAILSTPSFLQQLGFDQPNNAILHFPVTYLASTIVPIVYLSHFLSIRSELSRRKRHDSSN